MKRIILIGSGGAGKSTLARQLSTALNINVVHLDALYWKPNWTPTPKEEWQVTMRSLVAEEQWIIDGNFGGTCWLRFEAADTIIFLDFPRLLCLRRVVQRRWRYRNKTRPDMGTGCMEKLDWAFLRWIWNFPNQSRPKILREMEEFRSGRNLIVLRHPREVKLLLRQLQESSNQ